MTKDKYLIEYKKETFWSKLKKKILSIFSKKKQEKYINSNIIFQTDSQLEEKFINKEQFFDIYSRVKENSIEVSSLDKNTLYQIMLMINEELDINSKKIDDKIKAIDISLDNLKMYNKEIEFLKRNS